MIHGDGGGAWYDHGTMVVVHHGTTMVMVVVHHGTTMVVVHGDHGHGHGHGGGASPMMVVIV
jgi:hypothetical protein